MMHKRHFDVKHINAAFMTLQKTNLVLLFGSA